MFKAISFPPQTLNCLRRCLCTGRVLSVRTYEHIAGDFIHNIDANTLKIIYIMLIWACACNLADGSSHESQSPCQQWTHAQRCMAELGHEIQTQLLRLTIKSNCWLNIRCQRQCGAIAALVGRVPNTCEWFWIPHNVGKTKATQRSVKAVGHCDYCQWLWNYVMFCVCEK